MHTGLRLLQIHHLSVLGEQTTASVCMGQVDLWAPFLRRLIGSQAFSRVGLALRNVSSPCCVLRNLESLYSLLLVL